MIQALLQCLARWLDRPFFPWKRLVMGFSLAEFTLENWLLFRQFRVLQRDTPPKALDNEISRDTFAKSQAYGRAKAKFSFVSSVVADTKNLAILTCNVYPRAWALAGTLLAQFAPARFSGEIAQSLLFVWLLSLVDLASGLPFQYYYTFVLEQRFGFNKMTTRLWITDLIKGQLLTIAFGLPIGSAFLAIIKRTGQSFFYYLWLFMFGVQIAAITIYPIVIVPLFNKLSPLQPGTLKEAVEALASKLKFPLTELQVIDGSKRSSHSNAYFTGLPWKKKIVIFDTLLEKSSEKEVEAVLAHELGHWRKGHTTKLLAISQVHLFYIFALFSCFIDNGSMYDAFGFYHERPVLVGFILFASILTPTDAVLKLLMNVLTRRFEFEADAFADDLGYKPELGSALLKLQVQNLSSMDADPLYSSFHYSHPILTERLKALRWARKNDDGEKTEAKEGVVTAADREL